MFEGFSLLPSGHVVFVPPKEFDLGAVPDVEAELGSLLELHRYVVIDLSDVTFIDSSGLSSLLWARQQGIKLGGDVVVVGPSQRTLRLLEITQLDQVLPLYPSLDDVPPAQAAG